MIVAREKEEKEEDVQETLLMEVKGIKEEFTTFVSFYRIFIYIYYRKRNWDRS
jgi:hypothetical protein